MPEPTTRDEHRREAERQAKLATRGTPTTAAVNAASAQAHALLYAGDLLAALLEHLTHPRVTAEPPRTFTYHFAEYDLTREYTDRIGVRWTFIGAAFGAHGMPLMARTDDTDEGRPTESTEVLTLAQVLDGCGPLQPYEAQS